MDVEITTKQTVHSVFFIFGVIITWLYVLHLIDKRGRAQVTNKEKQRGPVVPIGKISF